jgi:O-antigen ligase
MSFSVFSQHYREPSFLSRLLDLAVFVLLLGTFAVAPHRINEAAYLCTAASAVFAISLFVSPRSFRWHPLFRPVLVFLLLCALSTAFSSAPDWSWRRLGWFTLLLAVIVTASTLRTRARIIALVTVLLLSSLSILVRVGWQYTHGIGVTLADLPADNALVQHGLFPGDIIQTLNNHPTRSPSQFRKVLDATASEPGVTLGVARGAPIERVEIQLSRTELNTALSNVTLQRGHPVRAQAGFYHYVPFAGFMCVIALLAWGLTLAMRTITARVIFLIVTFAATAGVIASLTRMYLVALLIGAFAAFWMVSQRKWRILATAALGLSLVAATLFVSQERGIGWIAIGDAGTQYRIEMWHDGLILARQHPLLGIGLDAALSGKWQLSAYRDFPLKSHFHSTPLQLAVDTGLFTLAAWLWLAVVLFRTLLRSLRRLPRNDRWLRGVALGVFASAVAFYGASLVHYNQGDGEVMILMSILMGTVVAIDRLSASMRTHHAERKHRVVPQPAPVAKAG